MLLAIDPGEHGGWSLFNAFERLMGAGKFDGDRITTLNAPWRWASIDSLIIERPIYRPLDRKSKPNDLITLAIRAGRVAGVCSVVPARYVTPDEWKASVPKPQHQQRILAALTDAERMLIAGASHDTIDAVGLGLWALGRMNRGGR